MLSRRKTNRRKGKKKKWITLFLVAVFWFMYGKKEERINRLA